MAVTDKEDVLVANTVVLQSCRIGCAGIAADAPFFQHFLPLQLDGLNGFLHRWGLHVE